MKASKDIGVQIKDKFECYKNSPDDFVWGKIEERLRKRRRKTVLWYFTLGALGLLILVFGMFQSQKSDPFNKPSNENNEPTVKIDSEKIPIKNHILYDKHQPMNSVAEGDDLTIQKDEPIAQKEKTRDIQKEENKKSSFDSAEKIKENNDGTKLNSKFTKTHSNSSTKKSKVSIQYSKESENKSVKSITNSSKLSNDRDSVNNQLSKTQIENIKDSIPKTEKELLKKEQKSESEEEQKKDSLQKRSKKWGINP